MPKSVHPADRYGEAFANLTPENLNQLCALVADQVYFSDPFNQITGKASFRAIFDHMYDVCHDPDFDITDIAHSEQASYLRWKMTGRLKSWPNTDLNFEGMTEVRYDAKGIITHHIDHWDSASQLLQHLPVIGIFIRTIQSSFKLPNR